MGLDLIKKVPVWAWLGGAAVVALYVIKKGGVEGAAQGVVAGAVGSAGDILAGAASGVVLGIGDVVGLPRTDTDKCKSAIMAANNWDASFYCTASVYSRWQYLSLRKKISGQTFTLNDVFN